MPLGPDRARLGLAGGTVSVRSGLAGAGRLTTEVVGGVSPGLGLGPFRSDRFAEEAL